MRIRILEVDATPQEIEQSPKLRDLLGSFARAGASVPASRLEQAPDQPAKADRAEAAAVSVSAVPYLKV